MKNFEEFMLDWWENFISDASDELCDALMSERIGEEETLSDYIPSEAEDSREWLLSNVDNGTEIYTHYFGDEGEDWMEEMPHTSELLVEMFTQAFSYNYSFAEDFIDDMADHADCYSTPDGFFKDLAYGGCASGLIGMLIYNSDCKRIYIRHIDDMEDFKRELEGEMGEPLRNNQELPHYTFMCWLCYEEVGLQIARNLFPNVF